MSLAGTAAPAPYAARWRQFRRRRNVAWLVFAGYLPGVPALGLPLAGRFGSELPLYAIAALWLIAMLAAGVYAINWKCPRCGKPFLRDGWIHNAFARSCLHCGLPKWSTAP